MHTDETLTLLDSITGLLGRGLCRFQQKTCAAFDTQELKREAERRQRRGQKNTAGNSTTLATSQATRRKKAFNLQTYKLHALGDYVSSICKYGTTDSYSTETVSICARESAFFTYIANRESWNIVLPRQGIIEPIGSSS